MILHRYLTYSFLIVFFSCTSVDSDKKSKKERIDDTEAIDTDKKIGASFISVYLKKQKPKIRLGEMWWSNSWPFSDYKLKAFDLVKEFKGKQFELVNLFFLDSTNYDYKAITTLNPNYRLLFYGIDSLLYKEVLVSLNPWNSGAFLISLPEVNTKGNECLFLTPSASKELYQLIK